MDSSAPSSMGSSSIPITGTTVTHRSTAAHSLTESTTPMPHHHASPQRRRRKRPMKRITSDPMINNNHHHHPVNTASRRNPSPPVRSWWSGWVSSFPSMVSSNHNRSSNSGGIALTNPNSHNHTTTTAASLSDPDDLHSYDSGTDLYSLEEEQQLIPILSSSLEGSQDPPLEHSTVDLGGSSSKATTMTSPTTTPTLSAVPTSVYILLLLATVSLSAIGPLLELQHSVSTPVLKVFWRTTATSLVLSPLALWWHATTTTITTTTSAAAPTKSNPSTPPRWFLLPRLALISFFYTCQIVCFVLALQYTTVGNAVSWSNAQSLVLLVLKVFCWKQPVSVWEAGGALVAFGGVLLCSHDSAAATATTTSSSSTADNNELMDPHAASHRSHHHHHHRHGIDAIATVHDHYQTDSSNSSLWAALWWTMVGNAFALVSSIAGVGYLTLAKEIRRHMTNLPLFLWSVMAGSSLYALVWISLTTTTMTSETNDAQPGGVPVVTWDANPNHGLWGWLSFARMDRLPLELVLVLLCNVGGVMGYAHCLHYLDPLVIAVAALMEPVVAEVLASLAHVSPWPGLTGWTGNVLVTAGTVTLVWYSNQQPAPPPQTQPPKHSSSSSPHHTQTKKHDDHYPH